MESQVDFLAQEAGPSYQVKKKKNKRLESVRMNWQKHMTMLGTSKPGVSLPPNEVVGQSGEDSDDDMELELTQNELAQHQNKVKEADSIKRVLTDLHRRGKLLSNYAIINSTGFIKIIKKFNKNFPEMKSDFKQLSEDGFICGDGKKIRGLCSRMEQYYSTWFCGGNETEARSQLLPKKGDALDMDWSQLR